MSSWTRAIVIPLSIVHAMNPQRPVPGGFNVEELLMPGVPLSFPNDEGFWSWRNFFLHGRPVSEVVGAARVARLAHARPSAAPSSGCSSARATPTDSRAIYPPMMYVIMALDLLGYPQDHPDVSGSQAAVLEPAGRRSSAASSSSRASRWCGIRPSRRTRWANPGWLPDARADAARPTGC